MSDPALALPPRRSVAEIQEACCLHWGISRRELLSPRRQRELIAPRHAAMYLSRLLTPLSVGTIARLFERDHTTVLHAVDRMAQAVREDPDMRTAIDRVILSLGQAGAAAGRERESRAAAALEEMHAAGGCLAEARALAHRTMDGATPWGLVTGQMRMLAEGLVILEETLGLIAEGHDDPRGLARAVLGRGADEKETRP